MCTHRKLDAEVFGPEEVHDPRDPPLFFRHLFPIIRHCRVRSIPPHWGRSNCRRTSSRAGRSVLLIPNEDVTQLEDALDVFGRIDHGLVLEHARDDGVRHTSPRSVRLVVQQLFVTRQGEQGQDVDVVLDRREQEGEQVRRRGRVVDVGGGGVRGALVQGEGEDLVDVGELGRVAR